MLAFHRASRIAAAFAGLLAGGLAAVAWADEPGKWEYNHACASCHGIDGQSEGPMSSMLTIVVPSLTRLSADNGGEFPLDHVIRTIDGRNDVRAHGSGMPIWGAVFADPLAAEVTGRSTEYLTQMRILALAYYLETLQK